LQPPSQNEANFSATIDAIYRDQSRRVFATLIRLLGDFDRAEEALHEAFRAAVEQWPSSGIPENPRAWLVSAGRFKAIDQIRREAKHDSVDDDENALANVESLTDPAVSWDEREDIEDDRLRLIFTCCHPALAPDAQIALTLREVCGLTTEDIAAAYLTTPTTIAQRIVRAKAKIRDARIPYEVPSGDARHERLDSVLRVIYLIYNREYRPTQSSNAQFTQAEREAIYLARLLQEIDASPAVYGLLALLLFTESRHQTRLDANGDLVLLEHQDRSRWDRAMIAEGLALTRRAFDASGGSAISTYSIQAAIAALHAEAPRYEDTDWREIVGLYDLLMRVEPTPVVALNRAAALAMRDGVEAALPIVERLLNDPALQNYHLAHATHADLCRRLNRDPDALASYERALMLANELTDKRFLARRIAELRSA
jgi:RNA polymerase sigma-70 factor, ECF subfamily